MSILDRIEKIRSDNHLNKSNFEKKIGASSGYLSTLRRNNSIPGTEVVIQIAKCFPDYSLNWILTGKKEETKSKNLDNNLISEPEQPYQKAELSHVVLGARDDIRNDLRIMLETMTENFKIVSEGVLTGLHNQHKILRFIEDLETAGAKDACVRLNNYLKQQEL